MTRRILALAPFCLGSTATAAGFGAPVIEGAEVPGH